MRKNVAGQSVGAQMVSASDGSAFTGAVTCYVVVDAGTQAIGSVGSGACGHKGNGFHSYAPAQAETNGDRLAFTFIGTGAIPVTVQVYTSFPQTGDSFARIGAAGAGLTALPWNAAWDAEVESECNDALVALHLDHLLAATYDPAAKPGVPDALFNELIGNDAGVSQFTANALELAPSGGGGGGGGGGQRPLRVDVGAVDQTITIFIPDPAQTDGSGKTGVLAADLTVSYTRVETDNDVTITDATASLNNLATLTDAHTDWGLKEINATLQPGYYRLDVADAVFATGASKAAVYVMLTSSSAVPSVTEFEIITPLTIADIAAEVWKVSLPGTFTAGQAGYIVGNNINAPLSAIPNSTQMDSKLAAADDATLAAIAALNNISTAQVRTEIDAALVAIHLDHLLAVTYDPDTKPGAPDALLNELIGSDAGIAQFTANALELGPGSGGTGQDWNADEKAAIKAILGIPLSGQTPTDPNSGILDTIRDATVAVKAKTDSLTFTVAGKVDSNVKSVTDLTVTGAGTSSDPWRPV